MMATVQITTYGPGGFDPRKPRGNVIDSRTVAAPAEDRSSPDARIAALEAQVAALKGVPEISARVDLDAVRAGPPVAMAALEVKP